MTSKLLRRTLMTALASALVSCATMGPKIEVEADARASRCPSGMAFVDAPPAPGDEPAPVTAKAPGKVKGYCIDKYEASLVEVTPHGEKAFSPFQSVDKRKVRAVSLPGVVPQAYISRNEADLACKASKKRLCTEDEWVRACEGKSPTTFPYGDERHPGYCNDSGKPPLRTLYGGAPDAHSWEPMNDPRLNQQPDTVSKTGSHPHCKSSWGAFDMMGNVHEWVDDPGGTFLGGYYLDTSINGDGCHYKTVAHDAAYHDYSTGFRCCADAR